MVVYGGDEVSALVFDVGSRLTKAGYAGEDLPQCVTSSYVGHIDHGDDAMTDGLPHPKYVVGDEHISTWRPNMQLQSPLSNGMISDWDKYEAIWNHLYKHQLRVNSSHHPLMIVEPSNNSRQQREKLLELAFEGFEVPALYFGRSAVLSTFATGKSSALVIESGSSSTNVVPVFDGYVLKKAIQTSPVGGDFVSAQVLEHLKHLGIDIVPQYLVENKESVDSTLPAKYTQKSRPNTTDSFHQFAIERVLHEFKEVVCHSAVAPYDQVLGELKKIALKNFEFPNGFNSPFAENRFKFVEGLFDPKHIVKTPGLEGKEIRTIPQLIAASCNSCEVELRSQLYSNIVLSGANTLLTGFHERLYTEMHYMAPGNKIKIVAAVGNAERKFGPWIGGSILASLGSFHQLWISKQQYEENGSSVEKRIH